MRARFSFYLFLWLVLIAILVVIALRMPDRARIALCSYAVVTWLAAIGVGMFEGSRIVSYLQRNHAAYLAGLRETVRRSYAPFPVMEYSLAGCREFLDSTDALGDPLLPQYRRRARRLRLLMPLAFLHWVVVIVLMLTCT